MEIKIKGKSYKTAHIRYSESLKNKLMMIFNDNHNKNKFKFYNIYNEGESGLLVCGLGSKDIREFERFYSIKDIHFYFNRLVKDVMGSRKTVIG